MIFIKGYPRDTNAAPKEKERQKNIDSIAEYGRLLEKSNLTDADVSAAMETNMIKEQETAAKIKKILIIIGVIGIVTAAAKAELIAAWIAKFQ